MYFYRPCKAIYTIQNDDNSNIMLQSQLYSFITRIRNNILDQIFCMVILTVVQLINFAIYLAIFGHLWPFLTMSVWPKFYYTVKNGRCIPPKITAMSH